MSKFPNINKVIDLRNDVDFVNKDKNSISDSFIGPGCEASFLRSLHHIFIECEEATFECEMKYRRENEFITKEDVQKFRDDLFYFSKKYLTVSLKDATKHFFEKESTKALFKKEKFEFFRAVILCECTEIDTEMYIKFGLGHYPKEEG